MSELQQSRYLSQYCLCFPHLLFMSFFRPQALCRFLFVGPPREGGFLLMQLVSLTKPLVDKVKPVPFDEFQKGGDWLIARGSVYYATMGNYVKGVTVEFQVLF